MRIKGLLFALIAIVFLLNACNNVQGDYDSVSRNDSNNSIKQNNSNVQKISPKVTKQDSKKPGDKGSEQKRILDMLKESLRIVNNQKESEEERLDELTNFTGNLEQLLSTKYSTYLKDIDLENELDIKVLSNTVSLDGKQVKIRIIRYDGLPELLGTSERIWTYIQWWDEQKTTTQLLVEQGAEIANDLLILKVNEKPTLVLIGYLTQYKPNPVFAAAWQLNNEKWEPYKAFSNNTASNDTWNFNCYENELIVESKTKDIIRVEPNQQKDGFVVSSENDPSKEIEFNF